MQTTDHDKPKMLRSTATVTRKDLLRQISTATGLQLDQIEDVFRAYADITRNNMLDGFNTVLPFIGVLKIVKQYIPETYNKHIVKKYGAIDIPKFNKKHKFTILFGPMLSIHPTWRLLITDVLPTNQTAHLIKKLPFEESYKKYDFQNTANNQLYDNIQEESQDENDFVILDNNTQDDKSIDL